MSNKTYILNELKEISPILLQLKENEKVVSVPEGYFDSLSDNVLSEISLISGLLASLKKDKAEVPGNYFDTFGDRIISKIKEEQKVKAIEQPTLKNRIYSLFSRVALAASIVGVIFLIRHIEQPVLPVNDCVDGIACLTQEEIYQYMTVHSHEFDVQQVQEVVQPTVNSDELKMEIETKEAARYLEENKLILEIDDTSTDIF